MRWKTRPLPLPKTGDKRTISKFAWKPTELGGQTVWLEFFGIEERFFQPISGSPGWWSESARYVHIYY